MFKKWTIAMNYKKLILKIVRVIILMCNDNYRYKFQGHFIERKISVKLLPIWFDKIFKFIKINDGIRSLVIFSSEKYNAISDRTNSHISEKVVLHIALFIILQELELIHIILYL